MTSGRFPSTSKLASKKEVALDAIVPFSSVKPKHYKIQKIEESFSFIPAVSPFFDRMKAFMDHKPLGREHIERFFKVFHELLRLLDLEELEKACEKLIQTIERMPGVAEIKGGKLLFAEGSTPDFRSRIIAGDGEVAFLLHHYRLANDRFQSAQLSEKIVSELANKTERLENMKLSLKKEELQEKDEMVSEMVMTESWKILQDIDEVLKNCARSESRDLAKESEIKSLAIVKEEMSRLDDYVSDKLLFIIKARNTQKLPPKLIQVLRKNSAKIGKIFRGKIHLLTHIIDQPIVHENRALRKSFEHLELTLLYTIQTVPYQDIFCRTGQCQVQDMLQYFCLYANLLRDIEPTDLKKLKFSESCDIELHFVHPVADKSLEEIVKRLEGLNDDNRITPIILQKLFDNLMADIEGWRSKRQGKEDSDSEVILGLKKWLIASQLRSKIRYSLDCLMKLKYSLDNFKEDMPGKKFILPKELTTLLREVCYNFAILLDEDEKLSSIFSGEDYLYLLRRSRDPATYLLRRAIAHITKDTPYNDLKLPAIMREILDIFTSYTEEAISNSNNQDLIRFEDMIHQELRNMGYEQSLLEALQENQIVEELMQLPWIKNQSWNRSMVEHIVDICKAIQFSIELPQPNVNPK